MVESAMNLAGKDDKILRMRHLSDYFQDKFSRLSPADTAEQSEGLDMKARLREYERQLMKESLERNDYNIHKVAEEFSMTRQNVYLRMKKLGISVGEKKFVK